MKPTRIRVPAPDPRLAKASAPPTGPLRRPSYLWLAGEVPRAVGEMAWLQAARPVLSRAPRGELQHVLVLPGLGASDRSTMTMRRYLRQLGYHTHGWRLGQNVPGPRMADRLSDRLERLYAADPAPITIVGWSLGGLYARLIARQLPDTVRRVITLGSPFRTVPGQESHPARFIRAAAERQGYKVDVANLLTDDRPLPVPSTAVFTRTDGIVPWEACVDTKGGPHESIEVIGSHCGLGHHPAVMWVVADRLAQPAGEFVPMRIPAPWRPVLRAHPGL